jgi:Bacterial Ig-like domain (group 3)/Beta-propeller repeat
LPPRRFPAPVPRSVPESDTNHHHTAKLLRRSLRHHKEITEMRARDFFPRSSDRRRSWPATRPARALQTQVETLEDRQLLSGATASILQSYGQVPLSFEANVGQTDPSVHFLARGSGYTLFVTSDRAVLSLSTANSSTSNPGGTATSTLLSVNLLGANSNPRIAGVDQLSGSSNYLVGSDPSQWHTNVPNYGRVQLAGVYPGVDLAYYGNQQQLEYDFTIAPGAAPGVIKMAIGGASSQSLDAQGNLVLHTSCGDVVEQAPVIYQLNSDDTRQAISGQYVIDENGDIGFSIGSYDTSKPLVIDPTLAYSTYLGGTGDDDGSGIAVDADGNAYITGYSASTDFPTQNPLQGAPGSPNGQSFHANDAFVTKINAAGTAIVYSTYIGGNDEDEAIGIAVDSDKYAYITGLTRSTNFPTVNALQPTYAGTDDPLFAGGDAFITKLNPTGSGLVFSTYLGSGGAETGFAIAVDANHDVYAVGRTDSVDFPLVSAAQSTYGGGSSDAYALKLKADGSALVYSTYLGGVMADQGIGLAVDSHGDAFVAGSTFSSDFPVTAGAFQTTYGGGMDAFATKLSPSGSSMVYSTYLGGGASDQANGVAIDSDGNAYITGTTFSSDFPTVQPIQSTYTNGGDAFVTKLDSSGSALVYSTFLGGSDYNRGYGIAIDAARDAFVVGTTDWDSLPLVNPVQATFGGFFDAFVAELNPAGSSLLFATYLCGSGSEDGNAIAVDPQGNIYLTGRTSSDGFPTAHPVQSQLAGDADVFVVRIAINHAVQVATTTLVGSSLDPSSVGQAVTFTATVAGVSGSTGTPTGTVSFMDGSTVLKVVDLNGGQASLTTSALVAGSHDIHGVYSGDATFLASSGDRSQHVSAVTTSNSFGTTTSVGSSASPSTEMQRVTFTATVTGAAGSQGTPTGSVTFMDGAANLQVVPLNASGMASFTTASLGTGTHHITAVYNGDANFSTSSGGISQVVDALEGGPRITLLQRYGYHMRPTLLVLTFDRALDAASAQNAANYRISDSSGRLIRVKSVKYDAATRTVTVRPAELLNIHHSYSFRVNGTGQSGVKSADGSLLDGAGAGQADSDYHAVIDWRKLVLTGPAKKNGAHPKGPLAARR